MSSRSKMANLRISDKPLYTYSDMFCPVCKTEYREGGKTCSDCHVELVNQLPEPYSPRAFDLLWSGESAVFQEQLRDELEKAKIGAVGIPPEVLLRNSTDVLGIGGRPRFGFAVCVSASDGPAARQILERLLEQEPTETSISASSIPLNAEEATVAAELPANWDSASASVQLWAGKDQSLLQFIEDSLHGVGVPTRRVAGEEEVIRLMIQPEDQERGREVVRQIAESSVPQKPLPGTNEFVWLDEPVKSYSLLWALGGAYLLLYVMSVSFPGLSRGATEFLDVLLGLATVTASIGQLWVLYQAVRYEIRPLLFCLLSIIPLSFAWYYNERYTKRQGVRRLPVAIRTRVYPPTSTRAIHPFEVALRSAQIWIPGKNR